MFSGLKPGVDLRLRYGNPGTAGLFGGGRGDILDKSWLKSMNELEWRRKIGDCPEWHEDKA